MITTPLDALCTVPFHEADAAARAAIMRRFADTVMYVALAGDVVEDRAELYRLSLPEGGEAALACDDEARLAAATARSTMFAAMPGRVLAGMLGATGLSLLVNPGAPSQMLLGPEAMSWLTDALAQAEPAQAEGAERGAQVLPPDPAVVEILAPALGERLIDMHGMAESVSLLRSGDGHLLLVHGAAPDAHSALAKALAELLAFLPPLPTAVDVGFTDAPPPACAVTLRLEALPPTPTAPKGPPRLR